VIPWFNDEPAHLHYVRYLYLYNHLPVQTASVQDDLKAGQHEYYQPPLYYYLARPFDALGHSLTPGRELIWVRIVSVLFSFGGLLALVQTVRVTMGLRIALLVLLLGSFSGVPLRHGYLAGNDSLFFMLACLEFGLALTALERGSDRRLLIAAMLVGAAGLWTKASFLLILPVFPLALLLAPRPSEKPIAERIISAFQAIAVPLLAIAPWYWWNNTHYGRLIPLDVGSGPPEPWGISNFGSRLYVTLNYFTRSLVFPYEGLWGSWLDKIIYPVEGLAFLLLVVWGFRHLRIMDLRLYKLTLGAVGLTLVGYLYFNLNYPQAEARHLLPAMPFIFCVMALAALRIQGKKRWGAYVLIGSWIVLPWVTQVI
jgi:4-amino-4-deoxy-L-arabinose transferase-like glycosyltransferase